MAIWDQAARERQRQRIKATKPEQHIGRKTGKRFDASALAAALMGFPKVRSF